MPTKLSKIAEKTGRTAWVKKWIEDFLKGLQPLSAKEVIEMYCLEQKGILEAEVKRRSEERAKKQGKEASEISQLNSAASHITKIRNAIKIWQQSINLTESNSYPHKTQDGIVSQHYALLYINYSQDKHEERMRPTQEKKDEQRRNLTPINCFDKYLETTKKLLASSDYRELSVGLIAATGRRISEILSTASFTRLGQFEVGFEGQLKAKGQTGEYPAFTIVESALVADGIAKLRRMKDIREMKQWNLAKIDSGKNNTVNRYVKQYFSELIDPPHGEKELSSKNLRAAYTAIAIYMFCPWSETESVFIKKRLGHTSDATASNYEDYQVVDVNGKPLTRGAWIDRTKEEMSKQKQITTEIRLQITLAAKELIDSQEFLPYPDRLSRIEELVRLAQIGKQYEEGKLKNETVKVVEVVKEVERIVEKPLEAIREARKQLEGVEQVEEASPVESVKPVEEVKSTVTRFEEMSSKELRGCQAPGSALEKIRRSVRAIKAYNETKAEKKDRWAINIKTLEDLSGCHWQAIKDYLASDEGRLQVADYNLEKEFGFHQNRGKGSIRQSVNW